MQPDGSRDIWLMERPSVSGLESLAHPRILEVIKVSIYGLNEMITPPATMNAPPRKMPRLGC